MTDSPVVALNHAVAVSMVRGPAPAIEMIDRIVGLERYHLFHAARAELLVRAGDAAGARDAFDAARALTDNDAERRHLTRRLGECSAPDVRA